MGQWFYGCPAYQSGPGKDGFQIDVSMASQSSFSKSLLAASRSRNVYIGDGPIIHHSVSSRKISVTKTGLDKKKTLVRGRSILFKRCCAIEYVVCNTTF